MSITIYILNNCCYNFSYKVITVMILINLHYGVISHHLNYNIILVTIHNNLRGMATIKF